MSKLVPAYNRLLIKPLHREEKSHGGILIPEKENQYREFELVAFGPTAGKDKETGAVVHELKKGMRVIIHNFRDTARIYHDGGDYYYCDDSDIKFFIEE